MRARVAYIHSFGTTTILVAAALLILAVGGAIVAFNGWPGTASDTHVGSVPVSRDASARGATPVRARPVARRPAAKAPAARPSRASSRTSTAGLVKTTPATGPGTTVVPGVVMVHVPATQTPAAAPVAQPAEVGGGTGDEVDPEPGVPGPVGPLPDAGSLLPPIALPPPPPAAPGPGIAGPEEGATVVSMVDDALGSANTVTTTVPPLPGVPSLPGVPGVPGVTTPQLPPLR